MVQPSRLSEQAIRLHQNNFQTNTNCGIQPQFLEKAVRCRFCLLVIGHRLVHGFDRHEAESAIEIDCSDVLGGDFQVSQKNRGAAESIQTTEYEVGSQSFPAVWRGNADVLDRTQPEFVANALDRAAVFRGIAIRWGIGQQPGRTWNESRFGGDIGHQPTAAIQRAQTGKDIGIQFTAKAVEFCRNKSFEQGIVPCQKTIIFQQGAQRKLASRQVDFHAEAFVVGDIQAHQL
jgi:hypothetical protein